MDELVSIIMPSYNTGQFIGESIKSVLSQTYDTWELIIVDDCSTDDTDAIVSSFSDSRIKYYKNNSNYGAAMSRNIALKRAHGKYVAFLDSDDLWHKDKLLKQVSFMRTNGFSFSYTDYEEINTNGDRTGVIVSGPKIITKSGMYNYCWPGCLTVMYDAFSIGLIEIKKIEKNNDYALWLEICSKEKCHLLKEQLAFYRRGRVGSISSHKTKELIKWHYKVWRVCKNKNPFLSFVLTIRNLFFGIIKKIFYVKRVKNSQ